MPIAISSTSRPVADCTEPLRTLSTSNRPVPNMPAPNRPPVPSRPHMRGPSMWHTWLVPRNWPPESTVSWHTAVMRRTRCTRTAQWQRDWSAWRRQRPAGRRGAAITHTHKIGSVIMLLYVVACKVIADADYTYDLEHDCW